MAFDITCLGASGEVGRSAFIVKTDKTILLDYGIKIFDKSGQPKFPEAFKENLDLMILSHAHLDHSGNLPFLYTFSKTKWLGTPATHDLIELLLADSMKIMEGKLPYDLTHYNKALKYWIPAVTNRTMSTGKTNVKMFDAGHIAGAVMIEMEHNGKKLLYTGDFKGEDTRMHRGAKYNEEVDVLMVDCTYAMREHPDRKKTEQQLADEIKETIKDGGTVLLPAFALGRSQELIRLVRAYNKKVPVYLDGMGKAITSVYMKYPDMIKDASGFRKDVETIHRVNGPEERMDATNEPGVIISSAGMLEGGPALRYLTNLNPDSKIIFTGYNVEGTNGWRLLNEGQLMIEGNMLTVDLPVEYFDFSAHGGKSDIMKLIKKTNPEKIICIHGDKTAEFATELNGMGFDAVAPSILDRIRVD
ncbi:MAG: MBL fold metallo-hydrolase [Candidatus Micrarchaeia archaeon]